MTAKLESLQPESLQDQLYSPVKHHAPAMLKYGQFSGMHPPHSKSTGIPSLLLKEPMPFHLLPQHSPQQNQSMVGPYSTSKGSSKTLLQRFQEQLSTNSSEKMAEMALIKECDIEKFAQDNLNLHSKGIFRKKSSVRDMLSWTGNAITRPMLSLARDKAGKKLAIDIFKLVQIYMGDRKARAGMSLVS